jgi:hypothetical protein
MQSHIFLFHSPNFLSNFQLKELFIALYFDKYIVVIQNTSIKAINCTLL